MPTRVNKEVEMTKTPMFVVAAAVLLMAACAGQPEEPQAPADEAVVGSGWTELAVDGLSEAQQAQRQRSLDAIQAVAGRLMGELTTALDEGGPEVAIEVCSHRAPEISATVANEYGVMVGRTSFRLRNSTNLAPQWARLLVERRVEEPTWMAGPEGQLVGLVPIRLKPECGICHGPREAIAPEVLSKLAEFYPEDDAVGFADGELRGWFWVEAPSG